MYTCVRVLKGINYCLSVCPDEKLQLTIHRPYSCNHIINHKRSPQLTLIANCNFKGQFSSWPHRFDLVENSNKGEVCERKGAVVR